MKSCSRCGTEYEDSLERCPEDGAELVPVSARSADSAGNPTEAFPLEGSGAVVEKTELFSLEESRETLEKTSEMAREIHDLILKVCSHCHSAYHGDIDVCPQDGTRLIEPSVLARQSFFAGGNLNTAFLELKKHCPSCSLHFDLDVERCKECDRPLAIPTLGGGPLGGEGPAAPNALIADKYRILSTIDSGGFGCVHLAKHESLGKRFAIKVLRGKFSDTKEFRNRFHEEALKLSRLEDENVVKVFDFGECKDSQYMVTEYVDGTDLGTIIYDEKVSPLRAAKLMRQVAAALAEAHSKKIVHLDLKPRNILVSQKRGRDIVKVIDFGIAEIYSESGPSRQETVAGTCTYMAPEQWRHEPLDPRTDIYSFGVIFYELLAGRPPFRQTKVSEIEKAHLKSAPPLLRKLRPDVPIELERLIQQCMEKKPEKRIQSAEELEARLSSYVARTENVLRRWVVRAGVAVVAVAVLTVSILGVWSAQIDKSAPMLSFDVRAEDARAFKPVGDAPAWSYRTYEEEVRLRFEADDDREVSEVTVHLNGKPHAVKDGEGILPLRLGENNLVSRALDTSGNASEPVKLTIHRLRRPALEPRLESPAYTNRSPARVVFDAFASVSARIIRRVEGQSPHLVSELEVGDDPVVDVDLVPGRNVVTITATDTLNGQPLPEQSLIVNYLAEPLGVEARVLTGSRTVPYGDSWLTSEEEVDVVVQVEDAAGRLEPGEVLRRSVNGKVSRPEWTREELEAGEKPIRVRLTEGENQIRVLEFEDRYGNRSSEESLSVVLDTEKPRLKIEGERQVVEYFDESLPRIFFEYSDETAEADEPFSVLRADGTDVSDSSYEIVPAPDGGELRFTDATPFPGDGRHDFEIRARDLVQNEQEAPFSILVDQNAPEILEVKIPAQKAFRRGDEVAFRLKVRDAFLEEVRLEIRVDGGKKVVAAAMDSVGNGVWEKILEVGEHFEKPRIFDSLDPKFHVVFTAEDGSGKTKRTEEYDLAFAWENGDRLRWLKDRSIVLVYHEEGRAEGIVDVPAFFIQETEVSNRQYARFLAEKGGPWALPKNLPEDFESAQGIKSGREDWPVRGIPPRAAEDYARWARLELTRRDQWLVAAFWSYDDVRERRFPWGDRPKSPSPVNGGESNPSDVADPGNEFTSGRTPTGVRHMFGNVWECVVDEETGEFHQMGGAFTTPRSWFEQGSDKLKHHLRGRGVEGAPIRLAPLDIEYDLGFRCTLRAKGAR